MSRELTHERVSTDGPSVALKTWTFSEAVSPVEVVRALDHELGGAVRSHCERTCTATPAGSSRKGTTGTSAWSGT